MAIRPKRTIMEVQNNGIQNHKAYDYAKKNGERRIAFTHYFQMCEKSGCFPFNYGGFMVCNSCGNKMWIKRMVEVKLKKTETNIVIRS
jgi:hypothetical protein